MRSLIIGGTRNLGPGIVQALLQQGHNVAVLNRGQTHDDLPEEVERLRGDRTDAGQLKLVLAGREFDLVVDTTLYTGAEAETAVDLFAGRVARTYSSAPARCISCGSAQNVPLGKRIIPDR
jgi:nucleoside-diphosphate-sugar epimerase